MMPQTAFMVSANIATGRKDELRQRLNAMTTGSGMADPNNALFPFGRFKRLHMARFFILEARTADDMTEHGKPPRPWVPTLVFLGDVDGLEDNFLKEVAEQCETELRQIFSCCDDFTADGSTLYQWMRRHSTRAAANYVNWLGRTVVQIHEEAALHTSLSHRLNELHNEMDISHVRIVRQKLLAYVEFEKQAGHVHLSPAPKTPIRWLIRHYTNLVAVPLFLVVILPLLLLVSPLIAFQLRRLEKSDPEIYPRYDSEHVLNLAQHEDHDVSNQFSAFGDIKPGRFRLYLTKFVLLLIDYAARHVFKRGFLARVRSIHFARWVFMDNNHRVLFISNYDGSHEAYMDDFINKAAWGLNLVFSNGVGWPRTRWLLKQGAEQETKFKYYQRRHQVHTDVWYKAYPGLTAVDLERNHRIRDGVEHRQASDDDIRAWLALI
jgi:hypothetical protein